MYIIGGLVSYNRFTYSLGALLRRIAGLIMCNRRLYHIQSDVLLHAIGGLVIYNRRLHYKQQQALSYTIGSHFDMIGGLLICNRKPYYIQ